MNKLRHAVLALGFMVAAVACGEGPMEEPDEPFKFAELFPLREQINEMAPLEPFKARDGTVLMGSPSILGADRDWAPIGIQPK